MKKFGSSYMVIPKNWGNPGAIFIWPFDIPESKVFRIVIPLQTYEENYRSFVVSAKNQQQAIDLLIDWVMVEIETGNTDMTEYAKETFTSDASEYEKMAFTKHSKKDVWFKENFFIREDVLPLIGVRVVKYTTSKEDTEETEIEDRKMGFHELPKFHWQCFRHIVERTPGFFYLRSMDFPIEGTSDFYWFEAWFTDSKNRPICDKEMLSWIMQHI